MHSFKYANEIEAYEDFLAGNTKASYLITKDDNYYNEYEKVDSGVEDFIYGESYSLEDVYDMMKGFFYYEGKTEYTSFKNAEYAYIDYGSDGVKELLLRFSWDGLWHDMQNDPVYDVVIRYRTSGLEIIHVNDRYSFTTLNTAGVAVSEDNDPYTGVYVYTYAAPDSTGKLQFLFHYIKEEVNLADSETSIISHMTEEEQEALDDTTIITYCFDDHEPERYMWEPHFSESDNKIFRSESGHYNCDNDDTLEWISTDCDEKDALINKILEREGYRYYSYEEEINYIDEAADKMGYSYDDVMNRDLEFFELHNEFFK